MLRNATVQTLLGATSICIALTLVAADPCGRIHGMVNNMHMSIALGSFDIDAVTAVTFRPLYCHLTVSSAQQLSFR
jgi:hypothetical protein